MNCGDPEKHTDDACPIATNLEVVPNDRPVSDHRHVWSNV
jgi:hypothetical protein